MPAGCWHRQKNKQNQSIMTTTTNNIIFVTKTWTNRCYGLCQNVKFKLRMVLTVWNTVFFMILLFVHQLAFFNLRKNNKHFLCVLIVHVPWKDAHKHIGNEMSLADVRPPTYLHVFRFYQYFYYATKYARINNHFRLSRYE